MIEAKTLRDARCILTAVALASVAVRGLPARAEQPPDLATYVELGRYYIRPVSPKKDARTGFVVGGKNDTALLRGLREINGRTIAELEQDMRPGAKSDVGSEGGFLGQDEKLLDVLAADNQYVVDELGLTHQELAKHLYAMATIGLWQSQPAPEFVYRGRRFKVTVLMTAGTQPSPFRDGTESGATVRLENLDNGKMLEYALLVPYMIDRYGFYEGNGTPYRLEPRKVVAVFDFLETKQK